MRSQQSLMKSQNGFMKSQNSLTKSPQRGATIHDSRRSIYEDSQSLNMSQSHSHSTPCSTPTKNGTLRKRPVPTPRTILNTVPSTEMISTKSYHKIDKLIR